jgi:hypothetical protein
MALVGTEARCVWYLNMQCGDGIITFYAARDTDFLPHDTTFHQHIPLCKVHMT